MNEQADPIDPGDLDDEVAQKAFSECMRLWFGPEYERRVASGQMAPDTEIVSAQIVFRPDQNIIRFNNQIRGQGFARSVRDVKEREPISHGDLASIENWELAPDEIDFGHITIFKMEGGWQCFFNFLRGRARADALAARAGNFLSAAKNAHQEGWHDVAVDNLFSACELLAKANLIVHMQKGAESKSHDTVSSAINQWRKLGNVEAKFVKLFNKLSNLRHIARYEVSEPSRLELPSGDFDVVAAQVFAVRDLCAHRLTSERRRPTRVNAIIDEPES